MASLDSIDRRLLAELQDEGRVTNVELAQRVGLTAPPCLRRVRALEEEGVIDRRSYAETPPRVEYELTPKGVALLPSGRGTLEWPPGLVTVTVKSR